MPKVKAATVPVKKTAPAKTAEPATKRKISAYNAYMKEELPKYKAANPGIEHKEAFKQVAGKWKTSAQNPKRV